MLQKIYSWSGGITVRAFVFIATKTMSEYFVYKELEGIPEVTTSWLVLGKPDLVTQIDAENVEKIRKIVIEKIRTIPGVTGTETYLSINATL